jgi:hypothetical protein
MISILAAFGYFQILLPEHPVIKTTKTVNDVAQSSGTSALSILEHKEMEL